MNLQYTPYVLPLAVAALGAIVLAVIAWQRRRISGAKSVALLNAALALWLVCYAFQILSRDRDSVIFWSNLAFLGIAFVPVVWLTFALEYSGRGRWLEPTNIVLLSVVPLFTQFMVWTNVSLGFFRSDIKLETVGSLLVFSSNQQFGFWVHTAYSYLLIVVGIVVLTTMVFRSSGLYRRQAVVLLTGAVVPLFVNVMFLFVFETDFLLDPTPFSLMMTSFMFAVGLFRLRLLDVVPLARDVVVEGMHDGVIVLNLEHRVVDINQAARRIVECTTAEAIGQHIVDLFPKWRTLIESPPETIETQSAEIILGPEDARFTYDVRISPLFDRQDSQTGQLIVLHDITDQRRTGQIMMRWLAQFQALPALPHELATGRDLDDLLPRVAELIHNRFGAYHVGVFLLERDGQYARLRAASGQSAGEILARKRRLRVNAAGIVSDALHLGRVQIVQDVARTALYVSDPLLPETRSEVVVPISVEQRVLGALDVHSTQLGAFDETSSDLPSAVLVLRTIADYLAIAIERIYALEEMAARMSEMERAYGQYTRESWRDLAPSSGRPLGYRYVRQGDTFELTAVDTPVGSTESVEQDAGYWEVPITLRDQRIGVLQLRFSENQDPSSLDTVMQEVANRVALTLESARLYEDSQRRVARERMIGEVTSRIRETSDMETMLRTATSELREALNLNGLLIRLAVPEDAEGSD